MKFLALLLLTHVSSLELWTRFGLTRSGVFKDLDHKTVEFQLR